MKEEPFQSVLKAGLVDGRGIGEVRNGVVVLSYAGQESRHFTTLTRNADHVLLGLVSQDDDASGYEGESEESGQCHEVHQVLQVE